MQRHKKKLQGTNRHPTEEATATSPAIDRVEIVILAHSHKHRPHPTDVVVSPSLQHSFKFSIYHYRCRRKHSVGVHFVN